MCVCVPFPRRVNDAVKGTLASDLAGMSRTSRAKISYTLSASGKYCFDDAFCICTWKRRARIKFIPVK